MDHPMLGIAAMRKLRAQQELAAANAALGVALRAIHYQDGVRKCHVGRTARNYLVLHGFGVEELEALAISDGSVRNMLDAE